MCVLECVRAVVYFGFFVWNHSASGDKKRRLGVSQHCKWIKGIWHSSIQSDGDVKMRQWLTDKHICTQTQCEWGNFSIKERWGAFPFIPPLGVSLQRAKTYLCNPSMPSSPLPLVLKFHYQSKRECSFKRVLLFVSVHTHVLTRQTHTKRTRPPPRHKKDTHRWCSALRSSPGGTDTCRLCRCRVWCRVGCTPAGHTPPPSSLPRSGRPHPCTLRGSHSRLSTPLTGGKNRGDLSFLSKHTKKNYFVSLFW